MVCKRLALVLVPELVLALVLVPVLVLLVLVPVVALSRSVFMETQRCSFGRCSGTPHLTPWAWSIIAIAALPGHPSREGFR